MRSTHDQLSNQSRSQSPTVIAFGVDTLLQRAEGDIDHAGGEEDEAGDHQQQPDDVARLPGHDQRPAEDEDRGKQSPGDAVGDEQGEIRPPSALRTSYQIPNAVTASGQGGEHPHDPGNDAF